MSSCEKGLYLSSFVPASESIFEAKSAFRDTSELGAVVAAGIFVEAPGIDPVEAATGVFGVTATGRLGFGLALAEALGIDTFVKGDFVYIFVYIYYLLVDTHLVREGGLNLLKESLLSFQLE